MMMPANYSVVAENEMMYVDGGWVEPMDFVLFEKNICTAIGTMGVNTLLSATIGKLFCGTVTKGSFDLSNDLYHWDLIKDNSFINKAGNIILSTIKYAGAIWVLGTYNATQGANSLFKVSGWKA